MLTTRQKTLRKFWYATVRMDALKDGPMPFRLMGEDIVLFLDAAGQPAALADRCCHRTAKLSKGWVDEGRIVCGYHGWTYDRDGRPGAHPAIRPGHRAAETPRAGVSLHRPLRLRLGGAGRAADRRSRRCRRTATRATAASSSSTTSGGRRRCG